LSPTIVPLRAFAQGRLFGEQIGDGSPAALGLHGWGRDRTDLGTALSGMDAVLVDLPGFGASPAPPEAWGAQGYAEGMLPLLEEFAGPVVVLGHSFGGRVAVCLAAAHPERVRALVLTGVPLLRPSGARRPAMKYRAIRSLHRAGLVSLARLERARFRYGSRDYRAASGVMRHVLVRAVNESYERELDVIRCPVELVWGQDDSEAPLAVAKRAAEMIPTARLTILPGKDHFTALRDPALRKAVENHLP
jgi:pimeloyl-ACP methyl ester carboxylesterase